jgi:type I restriction enzyme, S subunit
MSELPIGWASTKIGDLCDLVNGMAFKPTDWGNVGLPIIRIQNLNRPDAAFNLFGGSVDEKFLVRRGDLLFAWSGTPGTSFGAHIWNGPNAILNQHIFNVRYNQRAVEKTFFRYAINQTLDEQIAKAHGGVGLRHVTKGKFQETDIALPPLPEQRRIVAKIDSLSTRSRRACDHLDHIPRLVEKYKQALLTAAFRGELTRGWREARRETSNWNSVLAGTIIESIVAGKNLRCEERPPKKDEKGVLKVSAVTWGTFDCLATKTLPKSFVPPPHTRVQAGNFLISRANTLELVGAVVIVKETPPNLFLSDKILRLEIAEETKPWLLWFLRSPAGRNAIERSATGNQLSMRNLSQSALRDIEVPWTSDVERREIIRRIETAFAWIERLASETTTARKLIDHLDQTILAKAFLGELVPQDPNDEPASVLLERVNAEGNAGGSEKVKKRSVAA